MRRAPRYRSPEQRVEIFKTSYGPVLKAFAALEPPAQATLRDDLVNLIPAAGNCHPNEAASGGDDQAT